MRMRVQHDSSGIILVTALLVSTTLALLISSMGNRLMTELRVSEGSVASQQAFYSAEAGVDQGWTILNANPALALPAQCPAMAFPGAVTAGCTITRQADGTILIIGTGSVAGIQKTVQAVVEFPPTSVFKWALFADSRHMHFHGGGLIDSYDSSVGAYDPTAPKDPHGAPVQTNYNQAGALAIENGAELWGDAIVGVGGDPDNAIDTDGGGVIHGDRSAATSNAVLPPIIRPAGSPSGPRMNRCPNNRRIDVSTWGYSRVTLPPNCEITLVGDGVVHLDRLQIGNRGALTLEGDITLSTGSLYLVHHSELRVESGSAEIYVSGSTDLYQGNLVNRTEIPSNFMLYVEGNRSVRLNSSTRFHGAIYVPDGEVRLYGTAEVFGSLVTDHINATGAARVHYDQALATTPAPFAPGQGLVLRAWNQP